MEIKENSRSFNIIIQEHERYMLMNEIDFIVGLEKKMPILCTFYNYLKTMNR